MFTKKPPSETKPPDVPPVLRIGRPGQMESIAQEEPPKRISQAIIAQAFVESAEQITLTPGPQTTLVQFRIAGEWRDVMNIPASVWPGVLAAFKERAGLPVWQYRMELQGLLLVRYDEQDYDVSLEIVPTRYGEKIAMRIEAAEES